MFQPSVPLRPRNPDGKLRALVIGRISTEHQKEESIEASFRYVKEHLARIYDGPVELECLGERASGMLADRATIRRAEELITSGRTDVVVAEDLSRIYRNPRLQYDFVQNAVDNGCRVMCIADNLDTGTDNWELALGAAAFRHGMFIPDVRRRVRRSATHAFHNGGMVLKIRFGYRRLSKEEAASGHFGPKGLRIARDAGCTATIRQILEWVHNCISYVRIAERLNQAGIRPGQYANQEHWSARNVVNLLRDPILSGTRRFRVILHEPIFGTGKHRRRKGAQPETKSYPELAHLTVTEQQDLWQVMEQRASIWRAGTARVSQRLNVPRSKALWPGQSAACGICGGLMYDLGRHLKCQNALPGAARPCWNHVQVPIELARQKVVAWLIALTLTNSHLRETLINYALAEIETLQKGAQSDSQRIDRRLSELRTAAANLAKAVAKGGELDALIDELMAVNEQIQELETQKANQANAKRHDDGLPAIELIEVHLKDRLLALLGASYEFGDTFLGLIPEFRIVPVQALDTPLVRPRAKLTLRLSHLRDVPGEQVETETVSTAIDLFEPPEHIRWLNSCASLKVASPRSSLKRIAAQLGIGHMTAKRALDYARLMEAARTKEPYRELIERPSVASRWHPRRRPV
jgi:DNA invertase Pin-like site-specific DNA recombinase